MMTMETETLQGVLLDIHRCSLNDGPGIRTTVFLKGCPLRCLWCHNPESQKLKPEIDTEGKTWGKEATVDDIMDVVRQDIAYYESSGGGVTLSGGEPLAQPDFSLALLTAAKSEGIHTCLDTSGQASQSVLEATMPLTDVYHFDFKATGTERHMQLTGTDGQRIRENLEMLLDRGAKVILRCPMVPRVNDQPEHLQSIAALGAEHPDLKIEILPYHNLGSGKAERFCLPKHSFQAPTQTQIDHWTTQLEHYGCPTHQLTIPKA